MTLCHRTAPKTSASWWMNDEQYDAVACTCILDAPHRDTEHQCADHPEHTWPYRTGDTIPDPANPRAYFIRNHDTWVRITPQPTIEELRTQRDELGRALGQALGLAHRPDNQLRATLELLHATHLMMLERGE